MRKILVRESGNVAILEGPSVDTLHLIITKAKGGFDTIIEEYDGGTLPEHDWKKIKDKPNRTIKDLKGMEKHLKVLYKKGLNPELDQKRDLLNQKFRG